MDLTPYQISGLAFVGLLVVIVIAGVVLYRWTTDDEKRSIPRGYELNTYQANGRFHKIVPTFYAVPIAEGYSVRVYGMKGAIKRARRDIFAHFDNDVDIKNV